eukprot:m.69681 g.69681  ORF g.69681 m.69681 type:complete len:334 (-) comp7835_c0_seq1:209-1210(-)
MRVPLPTSPMATRRSLRIVSASSLLARRALLSPVLLCFCRTARVFPVLILLSATPLLAVVPCMFAEAGFGADIGAEKFFDIKCRESGLKPDCAVIVCSVTAIKMHGGGPKVVAGRPLAEEYENENLELVKNGVCNLHKQISNIAKFGVPVIVSVNQSFGTERERQFVIESARANGAAAAVQSDHFDNGGAGAIELAQKVKEVTSTVPSNFRFLYDVNQSIADKIRTIATELYNADDIELSDIAKKQISQFEEQGADKVPVCMAKTHLSLSHDATLKGVPSGFTLPIREVKMNYGAGFLTVYVGEMSTMPGLPTRPAFMDIDIDPESGEIFGLF